MMRTAVAYLLACAATLAGASMLLARDERVRSPPRPHAQPTAADTRKGAGFILGRTIDAGTGRPVAGAVVILTVVGAPATGGRAGLSPPPLAGPSASVPQRVVTTSDGYFFFRDLPGGRFSIAASAMGYLNGGYLQHKPNGARQPIDLGENEKRGDVQITLWKYGAISGTVLDEAGELAVGATVRLLSRGSVSTGRTELTDDRGNYRFGGVTPGAYIAGIITTQSTIPASLFENYLDLQTSDPNRFQMLRTEMLNAGAPALGPGARVGDLIFPLAGTARVGYTPPQPADDGTMLSYVTTFFPNAATSTEAATIAIGSGEDRTGVDLAIRLVPTVRVSGMLTGPEGPARHMGVSLVPAGTDPFVADGIIATATAAIDQNGAFTLLGVPAGSYTLTSTRTSIMRTGPTLPPMLWATQPVTVDRADLTGLELVLRPGLTMSGRLEFAGSKPAPAGQELQQFSVALAPAMTANAPRSSMVSVMTDGTFVTPGDLPGRYLATVVPGSPGWMLRSVRYNGRNIADESVELTSSDLAGVVVTFTDAPAKLTGTIVDAKGAPDPLAAVIIVPADVDGWRRGELNPRRMRRTAATKDGTFALGSLPAGQYYVVAVDDAVTDQWTDSRFLERLIVGATKLTIAEGETRTVALKTFAVR